MSPQSPKWHLVSNRSDYERIMELWPEKHSFAPDRTQAWFDLRDFTQSLGMQMDPYLKRHRITLIDTLGEAVLIYGNRTELKWLVMRLLGSIFRAFKHKQEARTVRLSCAVTGSEARFCIEDNAGKLADRNGCGLRFDQKRTQTIAHPLLHNLFGSDLEIEECADLSGSPIGGRFSIRLRALEIYSHSERVKLYLPQSILPPRLWLTPVAPNRAWLFWRVDPRLARTLHQSAPLKAVVQTAQHPPSTLTLGSAAGSCELNIADDTLKARLEMQSMGRSWTLACAQSSLPCENPQKKEEPFESWMTRSPNGVIERIEHRMARGFCAPALGQSIPRAPHPSALYAKEFL